MNNMSFTKQKVIYFFKRNIKNYINSLAYKIDHFTDMKIIDQEFGKRNFNKVKGIVIGRFQKVSKVNRDLLIKIIKSKQELKHIPVIANVDFRHTSPIFNFPIGGEAEIDNDCINL